MKPGAQTSEAVGSLGVAATIAYLVRELWAPEMELGAGIALGSAFLGLALVAAVYARARAVVKVREPQE